MVIPIAQGVPYQTQTTTLDGRRYRLSFAWNQRIERWFISVETDSGVPIVSNKVLALRSDILRQVRSNPLAPQGGLVAVDLRGTGVEPTLTDLGDRVKIFYFPEAA